MESKSKASYLKITAQKLRLVADVVRGKNAKKAEETLRLMPKRSARILGKLLRNAINIAEGRGDMDSDNLFVKSICVDEGPSQKRFIPRARGSPTKIIKRTSHVNLVLEER